MDREGKRQNEDEKRERESMRGDRATGTVGREEIMKIWMEGVGNEGQVVGTDDKNEWNSVLASHTLQRYCNVIFQNGNVFFWYK